MLGHESIGTLAFADVVAHRGRALHALGKESRHEERVIADVPPHVDFVLGTEVRRLVLPHVLDLEEHVDDGLEARHRGATRIEVLGTREAGEHGREVFRRGIVGDAEVVKGRPDGAVEETVELQPGSPLSLR